MIHYVYQHLLCIDYFSLWNNFQQTGSIVNSTESVKPFKAPMTNVADDILIF